MLENSQLQRVSAPDPLSRNERAACEVASACGGLLFRELGRAAGPYIAQVPPDGALGPMAVVCIGAACKDAERLASAYGVVHIVVLVLAEEPLRFEQRPGGRRLWLVPRAVLDDYQRRDDAGELVPRLIEFAFPGSDDRKVP